MSRIEEIEAAISGLTHGEFRRLAEWFRERENALWDARLDSDSSCEKLDFLFENAGTEAEQGLLREWPPSK